MISKADVCAGACGFRTQVQVKCEDGQSAVISIQSPCAKVQKLAAGLAEKGALDVYEEMSPAGASPLQQQVQAAGCCTGCVLPSAISKAMQISAGLMLCKDVTITFSEE